jgi:hypothetical protein
MARTESYRRALARRPHRVRWAPTVTEEIRAEIVAGAAFGEACEAVADRRSGPPHWQGDPGVKGYV